LYVVKICDGHLTNLAFIIYCYMLYKGIISNESVAKKEDYMQINSNISEWRDILLNLK